MLYAAYQALDDFFAPFRTGAEFALGYSPRVQAPFAGMLRTHAALMEMVRNNFV